MDVLSKQLSSNQKTHQTCWRCIFGVVLIGYVTSVKPTWGLIQEWTHTSTMKSVRGIHCHHSHTVDIPPRWIKDNLLCSVYWPSVMHLITDASPPIKHWKPHSSLASLSVIGPGWVAINGDALLRWSTSNQENTKENEWRRISPSLWEFFHHYAKKELKCSRKRAPHPQLLL